ncbi:MAG TPA: bifunctional riboflavin kinase/FAD synthetase [Egibacteraceae bacterium]|nr:bifunctional riboflavin kinase/FAD synthetase [Egibacteraceae bacterium]
MAEGASRADAARIVTGLGDVAPADSAVSIGLFDGVHRGHQTIIRRAVRQARDLRMRSVALTFDRHPMEVVRPGSQPKMLMTLARRARTLADLGVDLVAVLPFDDDLRHLEADEFIDHVLVSPLQARRVIVGSNFRFGHKAGGDVALLSDLGPSRGFTAEGVTLLELDGVVVSSTEIRGLLEAGDVARAAQMLGRPPLVDGVVVRGDRRGTVLGFPTANLQLPRRMAVPAPGVYAGCFHFPDGAAHPCATSVGTNPTFGGQELRVESFLLDYSGDLYGMTAAVDFRHRIRDEVRFDSADALVEQMHDDVATARALLNA